MILNKLKIYKYIGIVLKRWLVFLIANNRLYAEHNTYEASLNMLLVDGLALEMLPVHDNVDENNIDDTIVPV